MLDYQRRAVNEHGELTKKIEDLQAFLLSQQIENVAKDEQFRLKLQLLTMHTYAEVLSERIRHFEQ